MSGIDHYADEIGDSRYDLFFREAKPLDDELKAVKLKAVKVERLCYQCINQGDLLNAQQHAIHSYELWIKVHELGRGIDKLARTILRVHQFESSYCIGKMPSSPARRAFERLRDNPGMTAKEQEPFLELITLSPDGAEYSTHVSENILHGRFVAAEVLIASSATWSYHYSCVINQPFTHGEAAIRTSPKLWLRYQNRWGLGSGGGGGTPGVPGAPGAPGAPSAGKAGAAP